MVGVIAPFLYGLVLAAGFLRPAVGKGIIYEGRAPFNLTASSLDTSAGPYLTAVKGNFQNASHYSTFLSPLVAPPTPLWNKQLLPFLPATIPTEQTISIKIDNTSVFIPGGGTGAPQYGFRRTEFIAHINGSSSTAALNEEMETGVTVFHFSVKLDDRAPDGSHIFGIQLGSPFTNPTGPLPAPDAHSFKVLDHALNVLFKTPFNSRTWHNFAIQIDWDQRTLAVFYSKDGDHLKPVTSKPLPNLTAGTGLAGRGDFHFGVLKLPLVNPKDSPADQGDVVHHGTQEGTTEGSLYSGVFVERASEGSAQCTYSVHELSLTLSAPVITHMSATEAIAQPQAKAGGTTRGAGKRGGGSKHRGRGNQSSRGGRVVRANGSAPAATPVSVSEEKEQAVEAVPAADTTEDSDVCWICAEPVKYYSVSECNHRTCHVCALRLRALYKKTDCTFCKDPQASVIFTASRDAPFSSYAPESIPFKDAKLSIFFETQEMMEETLILLRFNCPDPDCVYIGNGWGDLKLHVRATHGKLMCDLCIRSKKVFAHEHALYSPNVLHAHLPSMYHKPHGKPIPKDQIEGGVHPLCEFCRECFFSDDELYVHMRERHEECFICKRNDIGHQYFQNYESLENHFNKAHHPCTQPQCLARKFVVFNTALDLQAHMVEEHGSDMSARDKKIAQRIQAEFEFEEVGGGGRHGRRDRGHRDREREPPPHHGPGQQEQALAPAPAPPGIVRPPGPGRRREGFGTSLTVEGAGPALSQVSPEPSRPPSPPRADLDPAIAERHATFIARLQSFATNPTNAVTVVKAAIRSYRASESSAKDLISTIWNVLDENLEHTASIVNAFVDLLDLEEKKQDLLAAWKGFEIEQRRQFPDLVPTAVASGSAPYAAITTGRVLNAKHITATRSSQRSSRQVWDRVAQAAGSSLPAQRPLDRFPALAISTAGPSQPAYRQAQRNTAWSASASSGFRPAAAMPTPAQAAASSHITVVPDPRSSKPSSGRSTPHQPPPKLSNALFPELRSSAPARQKAPVSGNVSLRNILGNPAPPAGTAWTAGGTSTSAGVGAGATAGQAAESGNDEVSSQAAGMGKGKKGKGKQKHTLFTLGSFPT
ncbi:putative zinc finger [Lyophyllum shimeji]|uniref:RING-type E3 ubiquitin transferase n=1 Tax=Lyophyllum shimeji TaxID=47721 RepID=A0A9P3UKJ4_LYOSH|nr:putative zinc finger [Lyophyllum shimeji]